MEQQPGKFRMRVENAAEAALKHFGYVGPVELFVNMQFLADSAVDQWLKGNPYVADLAATLQVGPEKYKRTVQFFNEWIEALQLKPVQMPYQRRTPQGLVTLRIDPDGDPADETFWITRFVPGNLPPSKAKRVAQKLAKAPDLVVFQKVSEEGNCTECQGELHKGSFIFKEGEKILCMDCADMGHLMFLPAGDATLSRRARKYSTLNAVVVRFNRRRNRYERQGILVTQEALDRAERECKADAPERAAMREIAREHRVVEDKEFVEEMTEAILKQFPRCPADEARTIASHTALRGSGRVGRSAMGRALDPAALRLAVRAHVRHTHTDYDERLMRGDERSDARSKVREAIERRLLEWS